jgi:hypothetical protein
MQKEGLQRYMPVAVVGVIVIAVLAIVFLIIRPGGDNPEEAAPAATTAPSALSGDAASIAQQRGLTPDDITAALKTYMPTGKHDDYLMFASGPFRPGICVGDAFDAAVEINSRFYAGAVAGVGLWGGIFNGSVGFRQRRRP